MTQRELTIIKQLLTDFYAELSKRNDVRSTDHRRLIDRSIRAIDREQQGNRNSHLIDTIQSWAKNTWTYLFRQSKR